MRPSILTPPTITYRKNNDSSFPQQTGYRYTGQRQEPDLAGGLYDYVARFYDPALGRFAQADTIVPEPGNPSDFNRYIYGANNPIRYNDPSGHVYDEGGGEGGVTPDDLSYKALMEYLVSSLMRKSNRGITLTEIEGLQLHNAARDLAQISGSDRAALFNSSLAAEDVAGVQDKLTYYRDNVGSLSGEDKRDFMILLVAVALEGMGQWGDSKSMKMGAPRSNNFPRDYQTNDTKKWSAWYNSERHARAIAREKLGQNPLEVEPGKWRSRDGKWQYRAKPIDLAENHIHLEELNSTTGEVLQNLHLRWK